MKKLTLTLATLALLVVGCKQATNENASDTAVDTDTYVEEAASTPEEETKATPVSADFSIESIPFSNADIGDFPFIGLPKGLIATNKGMIKPFDICFFPINGIMTPFEGKLYKTYVSPVYGEEFVQYYFEKSMEDYLTSLGAVKVFDGEITREEYNRYHKQDPNKGAEGDMGYWDQNMKFWVLRTKDKGNVYIQYGAYNAGASLNVLQDVDFEQTITKVTSNDIVADLTQKGKSILYINFDVDQAKITNEGNEVVTEIATALQKDKALKISIEGHTDNAGNAAHNKKLSENRAKAVMEKLTTLGVDKSRLTAVGFGSDKALVANDSEENKSKNRRVELVRI